MKYWYKSHQLQKFSFSIQREISEPTIIARAPSQQMLSLLYIVLLQVSMAMHA